MERIIRFDIEHLDEMGDLCQKTLIVELMGKHSNIIFCSSDGTIIDSIKHVSSMMSSVREVLPGRAYCIPATQEDKLNPLEVTEEVFMESVMKNLFPSQRQFMALLPGSACDCKRDLLPCFDRRRYAGRFARCRRQETPVP